MRLSQGSVRAAVLSAGLLCANLAQAYNLKLDNISDYEAFTVGETVCGATNGGGDCNRQGFDLIDPANGGSALLGPSDTLTLTVLSTKDEGELMSGSLKFTFDVLPNMVPVAGTLKAGQDLIAFSFVQDGNMFTGLFSSLRHGSSHIGVDVQLAAVPLPAAVWFFATGLAGLFVLRRRQNLRAT